MRIASALLVLLALTGTAAAGERSALSTIPVYAPGRELPRPDKDGIAGVKVITDGGWKHLSTTPDRCFVEHDETLRLSSTWSLGNTGELWQFSERDDALVLERSVFVSGKDPSELWIQRRGTVRLQRVANEHGIAVWAHREAGGDIVLIAKGAFTGRELPPAKLDEESFVRNVSSDCAWGAARIRPSLASAGTIAQLHGHVAGATAKQRFLVDGSLVKMARDPEPVLSIRVRRLED